MSEGRSVAITGANGYVGAVLRRAFAAAGWHVVSLQRGPSADPHDDVADYTLAGGPAQALPADLDAVVHCAYDLKARSVQDVERANIGGTRTLLAAAGHVPEFLLISSMSAYPGTAQLYGRTKLACEDLVTARGGTSLRLGLVYGTVPGAPAGGMVGALSKVATLPVVPVLRPDSHQFPVHAADMAACVVDAATHRPPHRVVGVAQPEPVSFRQIIATLHAAASPKPLRAVGVPAAVLYRGLRAVEAIGMRPGFRADSLLGLTRPAPSVPEVGYWHERGIDLRAFSAATTAGAA